METYHRETGMRFRRVSKTLTEIIGNKGQRTGFIQFCSAINQWEFKGGTGIYWYKEDLIRITNMMQVKNEKSKRASKGCSG